MPATSRSAGLKVSLACDSCRSRKRKCDGVRPVCGQCRVNNYTCAFNVHVDKRKPPSKTYVLALEARLKTLESRIQTLEQLLHDASIHVPTPESDGVDLSAFLEAGQRSSAEPDELDEGLPEDNGASVAALLDISTLRLDVSPSRPYSESTKSPESFTYFGPQSGRFLSGSDAVPYSGHHTRPDQQTWVPPCSPEEERAILNTFWTWQHTHLPFVLPDPFLASYNTGQYNCELVTPMLLDMIFTIGSYFGEGRERGPRFFEQAESRLFEEINNPRVATVQALLIMAVFQMGQAKMPVTWTLNGMVVALSTRLGLHIDTTSLVEKGSMPKHVKAARDSTFWVVFTLDRIFSTNMGLHPLLSRRSISTPKYQHLSKSSPGDSPDPATADKEIPAAVWFTLCEFFHMVEMMFAEVYAFDAPKRTAVQDCDLITKNMLTIQAFVDNFPRQLRSANAMRGTEPSLIFLHMRICLYIILLCRPFVGSRRYSPPPDSVLPLSAADVAAERRSRSLAFTHCRTAALRIIDLLRHLPPHSPCFTTPFFIFNASTVLLLTPQDTQAMRAVRAGLTCLEALEKEGVWADSATDVKQRIWGLAKRWEIGVLPRSESQGSRQAFTSLNRIDEHTEEQPSHIQRATHPQDLSPTSYTEHDEPMSTASLQTPYVYAPDYSPSPSGSGGSSRHQSPYPPYDYTNGVAPAYNPSQYEQVYLDTMPGPNVAIPWEGPVEPALWMMNDNTSSSYQGSWDFFVSNPTDAQADSHPVLSPVEVEILMQGLRRGNLGTRPAS